MRPRENGHYRGGDANAATLERRIGDKTPPNEDNAAKVAPAIAVPYTAHVRYKLGATS